MEISARDFMERQPTWPMVAHTDKYYLALARQLATAWDESLWLSDIDDEDRRDAVLAVIGYFQDIVADAGLWRTFTTLHQREHGTPLPHYKRSEEYVDYELNVDDLRMVLHYTMGLHHRLDPHDPQLLALAQVFFTLLDEVYVTAPVAVDLQLLLDVDLNDENDASRTYDLAYWLFWKSYLLRPWAEAAAAEAHPEAQRIIASCGDSDATPLLHDLNDRIMARTAAGPLPLSVGRWIEEIIASANS